MNTHTKKPPIGVVIPGFGHPQFLAEAVISACEQTLDREHKVVVVDDGCKFPETGRMVSQLMQKYAETLHYFRQKNTRLPGARNAGVRFLLALIPDVDSVYFLDADNRIAPYSLQAFRDTLGDNPEIGWAYPDISMFGLSGGEDGFDTRETAPIYSKLKHLAGNISEAGSLVRAELFHKGVFYDESMTSGYEDWEFWLSAMGAGYMGCRVRNSGFLYRRRPESMLADSRRLEATLIAGIREKHKKLYHPKHLQMLEHGEAPSFAILVEGRDEIILTSDPRVTTNTVSIKVFREMLRDWIFAPREYFFPTDMIFISEEKWLALQAVPAYLRFLFWNLREFQGPVTAVSLPDRDTFNHRRMPIDDIETIKSDFVVFKTSEVGSGVLEKRQGGIGVRGEVTSAELVQISLPGLGSIFGHKKTVVEQIVFAEQFVQGQAQGKPVSSHQTRHYAGPACLQIRKSLIGEICAVENREAFPVVSGLSRTMIFIGEEYLCSPISSKLFRNILTRIKNAGGETLVILEFEPGQSFADTDMAWLPLADDVVPLQLSGGDIEYRMYLGRRIPLKLGLIAKEDVTILARSCDALLSCGAAAGLEALGQAKLHGAKGYVWLDPAFATNSAQELAHQAKLLAFEHAVTKVVTDQVDYIQGLSAEGFPPSKFAATQDFWDSWGQ